MDQLLQFMTNHSGMWLLLAAILILIFIYEIISQKNQAKQLSPAKAIHLINNAQAEVFDIRDKEQYRLGHIINAISVTPEDFTQKRMEKYKSQPIILVCAKGITAANLAAKLRTLGYQNTNVLAGGMAAWTQENMPVVKGK